MQAVKVSPHIEQGEGVTWVYSTKYCDQYRAQVVCEAPPLQKRRNINGNQESRRFCPHGNINLLLREGVRR